MKSNININLESIQYLFSEYGIRNISMDEIAQNLHISKKTIYKQYPNKDELVKDIYMNDYYHFNASLQSLDKENNDVISKTIQLYRIVFCKASAIKGYVLFDLKKYYPDLLNKIIDLHRESIQKTFISALADGKVKQIFKDEINPHSVARIFTYLFESYVSDQISVPNEEYTLHWDDVFDYHFRSICNPVGLLKWENLKTPNPLDK